MSSWYSLEVLVAENEAIEKAIGVGEVRAATIFTAEYDLNTVYKMFMRIASPSFVIGKVAQLWRQYYDVGELVVLTNRPGYLELELRDFPIQKDLYCTALCGYMQKTVELTNCKNGRVEHPSCRSRGDERCIYHATWT